PGQERSAGGQKNGSLGSKAVALAALTPSAARPHRSENLGHCSQVMVSCQHARRRTCGGVASLGSEVVDYAAVGDWASRTAALRALTLNAHGALPKRSSLRLAALFDVLPVPLMLLRSALLRPALLH